MLDKCSDYQNNLLNRLAYVDIPGGWKSGDNLIPLIRGNYPDLADELEKYGFGGLVIRDYENKNENGNGFAAIAFENIYTGERGFSFRGTENLDKTISDTNDLVNERKTIEEVISNQIDMIDNISAAATGDSSQVSDAIAFYKKTGIQKEGTFCMAIQRAES